MLKNELYLFVASTREFRDFGATISFCLLWKTSNNLGYLLQS